MVGALIFRERRHLVAISLTPEALLDNDILAEHDFHGLAAAMHQRHRLRFVVNGVEIFQVFHSDDAPKRRSWPPDSADPSIAGGARMQPAARIGVHSRRLLKKPQFIPKK
jgi:hypothetical protein